MHGMHCSVVVPRREISLRGLQSAKPKARSRAFACTNAASTLGSLPVVVLKGGKKKMLLGDTPAVTLFPGSIDCVIGRPPPSRGDPVVVVDGSRESFLAFGVYNPESTFAVRILEFFGKDSFDGEKEVDLDHLIRTRLAAAATLRTDALALGRVTDAFRLCNAEGDRIPGLIVDVYGCVAVVQSSAAWIEANRAAVVGALEDMGYRVVWRPAVDMLALEGVVVQGDEAFEGAGEDEGAPSSNVVVEEHGIKFNVDTGSQKTGFYCDQRDNRQQIRSIAEGKSVADICCFSGGFAIYAATGGAARVVGVDSSQQAVDLATSNAALNRVDGVCEFVKADASDWMDQAIKAGQKFDIVILDPPKLAPNKKALTNATRKYVSLNAKAMRLVKNGGILMTCSCSGAMTQSGDFRSTVIAAAARRSGVQATVLSKAGAGADHTIDVRYSESEYLSAYLVRVM